MQNIREARTAYRRKVKILDICLCNPPCKGWQVMPNYHPETYIPFVPHLNTPERSQHKPSARQECEDSVCQASYTPFIALRQLLSNWNYFGLGPLQGPETVYSGPKACSMMRTPAAIPIQTRSACIAFHQDADTRRSLHSHD